MSAQQFKQKIRENRNKFLAESIQDISQHTTFKNYFEKSRLQPCLMNKQVTNIFILLSNN